MSDHLLAQMAADWLWANGHDSFEESQDPVVLAVAGRGWVDRPQDPGKGIRTISFLNETVIGTAVEKGWARTDILAQQLYELKAKMEWQPIETHPKESHSEFLVYNGEGIYVVYWDEEWDDGGWYMVYDGKFIDRPLRGAAPTHWMPLPAIPTGTTEG